MNGMKKTQYLRLQMNGLFGSIHKEITRMTNLKELYLFGNFFAGTIPKELAQMKKLEIVDLYANQLTGTIPKELAKMPNLSKYCFIFLPWYHREPVSYVALTLFLETDWPFKKSVCCPFPFHPLFLYTRYIHIQSIYRIFGFTRQQSYGNNAKRNLWQKIRRLNCRLSRALSRSEMRLLYSLLWRPACFSLFWPEN